MEQELSFGPLLDKDGNLSQRGFAYSLIKEYKRNDIKGTKSRIKEWDYYYIADNNYGIALTIDDNSYMGLVSLSVLDIQNGKEILTKSPIFWFPNGKTNLPSSSKDGDSIKIGKGYSFRFLNQLGKRHLLCEMKHVLGKEDFFCDIFLEESNPNSMVIATPFLKKRHFYYNQKINLLKAKGFFTLGKKRYEFQENAFGTLDWGRGVWTYKNTWYWSTANGISDGKRIGWNLGYGFGDTSAASENMLFVEDKAYKFQDVEFFIPKKGKKDDFLSSWDIKSKSGDISLHFLPSFNRKSNTNALLIQSDQNQVFGTFSGYFLVKDEKIIIDNVHGFAEKVKNRW